jgi:AAA family ATP:ADP antiporter
MSAGARATVPGPVTRAFLRTCRAVSVRPGEEVPFGWSCATAFLVMASYAAEKPLRDAMALAGDERKLPWLFLVTLGAMALVSPAVTALVSRTTPRALVTRVLHASALGMLAFWTLFHLGTGEALRVAAARAFFVWLSVFNLSALSVFWGVTSDVFDADQAARLFGPISVGVTLGLLAGSAASAALVEVLAPHHLLLLSVVLLEGAVITARRLVASSRRPAVHEASALPAARPRAANAAASSPLEGIREVLRSRYLMAIAAYLLFFTISSTWLYFAQASVVSRAVADTARRTAIFARLDVTVNLVTVAGQAFLTSRALRRLGTTFALAALPVCTLVGLCALAVRPGVTALVAVQLARRSTDYVLVKPARELLFTVVPREAKYEAKSFVDTFVYRAGDAIGALTLALLGVRLVPVAIGLCAVWGAVAIILGRAFAARSGARSS